MLYRVYQKVRSILMVVIQDLIWNRKSEYTFSEFVPVSELREHNTYLASLDFTAILSLSSVVKFSQLFSVSHLFLFQANTDQFQWWSRRVVSKMFTNEQYWDMHFVCGFSNGNAAAAKSEYRTPHFHKDTSIQRDGYIKPYTDGWGIQVCHNLPIVLVVQEIISEALHLIYLASRPCIEDRMRGGDSLNFVADVVMPMLDDIPLQSRRHLWYQVDGAPAHFTLPVRQKWLDHYFTCRWIGRGLSRCLASQIPRSDTIGLITLGLHEGESVQNGESKQRGARWKD